MNVFRILTFALSAIVALGAVAQDAAFVSLRPSALKQAGIIKPNETVFTGKEQISGTFDVIWEPGEEDQPGYYRVLIHPDQSSQQVLPHDSQRGPVREIWLRNTDDAIRAFLNSSQRKSLSSSPAHHATGHITIVLNSYRTGVDCDQRGYNAFLVSVVHRPSNVVADAPALNRPVGC